MAKWDFSFLKNKTNTGNLNKLILIGNLCLTSFIGVVAPVEGELRQFAMSIGGELGPEPGVLPEGDVSTEK